MNRCRLFHNRPFSIIALLALISPGVKEASAQQPSFLLDFEGPDRVSALRGGVARFAVKCTLDISGLNPGEEGPTGWSFGVLASGDCKIVQATTMGTRAARQRFGGLRHRQGFENTQLTSGPGNDGAVSAIILSSLDEVISLDPGGGPHQILGLLIEADLSNAEGCVDCKLEYRAGLQGTGAPVPLVVTYDNVSQDPNTRSKTIRICPVGCFQTEQTPPWAQRQIGREAVGSYRRNDQFYEICCTARGYGSSEDSLLTLSEQATEEFSMCVIVDSVDPQGEAGCEARAFTGISPAPSSAYGGARVQHTPNGHMLVSSFRADIGGRASQGNSKAIPVALPIMLCVSLEDKILTTRYSTDSGKTFTDHMIVDTMGTDLDNPFLHTGMAAASLSPPEGDSRVAVARFRDPTLEVKPNAEVPRLVVFNCPLVAPVGQRSRLVLEGMGLQDVIAVEAFGQPAELLSVDETSVMFELAAQKPVDFSFSDIVLHTSRGNRVLPNCLSLRGEGYIRCDCSGDGKHDITDHILHLTSLFVDNTKHCKCSATGDCNGDAKEDITDDVFGLTSLFVDNTRVPPPPYPSPGFAPGPICEGDEVPIITSISTPEARVGDIFTIQGSGFSEVPEENIVLAGDAQFTVLEATPTLLRVQTDMIVSSIGDVNIAVLRKIPDWLTIFSCHPSKCPPSILGVTDFLAAKIPFRLIGEQQDFVGTTDKTGKGGFVLPVSLEDLGARSEVSVTGNLLLPAILGASKAQGGMGLGEGGLGSRSIGLTHAFSSSRLPPEQKLVEVANAIGEALGGGRLPGDFDITPDPEGEVIRIEPRQSLRELLDRNLLPFPDGIITIYPGGPVGRCGPTNLHPINDEREFGWCRVEELVKPCNGLPAWEWYIPKSLVLSESENIWPLPHPNDRSTGQKRVMYNKAAYCHVRKHKLWNKCKLEDLALAGKGDVPAFPRSAWVLKTGWTTSLPPGTDPNTFYSYTPTGSSTPRYLIALHHTTKDINNWFWLDLYRPLQNTSSNIGGCGGRNDDIPASLVGTVWENYFLCTNVTHVQPLTEQSSPFQSAQCGNFFVDLECQDSVDLGSAGYDTCLNCHDGSTPGGPGLAFPFAGAFLNFSGNQINLDFLFSLQDGIFSPFPCDAGGSVSFASDIQPIFSSNCSCHAGGSPPAGLNLSLGNAYANTVNVPATQASLDRVEPANLNNSYLWRKLQGTQNGAGGCCAQMPLGAAPLAPGPMSSIQQWILDGAPNN